MMAGIWLGNDLDRLDSGPGTVRAPDEGSPGALHLTAHGRIPQPGVHRFDPAVELGQVVLAGEQLTPELRHACRTTFRAIRASSASLPPAGQPPLRASSRWLKNSSGTTVLLTSTSSARTVAAPSTKSVSDMPTASAAARSLTSTSGRTRKFSRVVTSVAAMPTPPPVHMTYVQANSTRLPLPPAIHLHPGGWARRGYNRAGRWSNPDDPPWHFDLSPAPPG